MTIVLRSGDLKAEILEPGTYRGSRFDWTGFIRQVTLLQGGHTFGGVESQVPGKGSGGLGLCNEFGIDAPLGYEEAEIGGKFPKPGIGLLTRTGEEAYNFFRPYETEPFPVRTEHGGDFVRFVQDPLPINGYAFRLEKEIRVHGAALTISYALHNTGGRPIATNEYVHNFLAIDGMPIGPEYELLYPETVRPEPGANPEQQASLAIEGGRIGWKPGKPRFYARFLPFAGEAPFYWELRHTAVRAGIRERGSERPVRLALWGEPHVVSPEIFVAVAVQPGGVQRWTRTFECFAWQAGGDRE
ncbi:hypothetical protein [Paenibacillus humicola]|uniref:hypothetical protein n=1 Tax=Paenibacillus humicola TaxID=3110540 RepID=UPI00237C0601|nr:hypothetical protein [Paenibacillus humicola]